MKSHPVIKLLSKVSRTSQLAIILFVSLMIVAGITDTIFKHKEKTYQIENLKEQSKKVFVFLSAIAADSVITENKENLDIIIRQTLRQGLDISYISFINEKNEIITQWENKEVHDGYDLPVFSRNVEVGGEVFGKIMIKFNFGKIAKHIEEHLNIMRGVIFGAFFSLTLILLFSLDHWMVHSGILNPPVKLTESPASELLEEKNSEQPATPGESPAAPVEPAIQLPPNPESFEGSAMLIIDDEMDSRVKAFKVLSRQGWTLLFEEDYEAGMELYKKFKSQIKLVLFPMVILEMLGDTERVYKEMRELSTEVKLLYSTGTKETTEYPAYLKGAPGVDFVEKPFNEDDLKKRVDTLLG